MQTTSNPEVLGFQKIVEQWYLSYGKIANTKDKQRSDILMKGGLDYAISYTIQRANEKPLVLIKMKSMSVQRREQFFALVKNDSSYTFDGIYEAKDITTIRTLFAGNSMIPGDSIKVRSLTNNPIKVWVGGVGGKVRNFKGMGVAKGQDVKVAFAKATKTASGTRSDYIPPIEECLAWFLIEYDQETHRILEVTFLYYSGECYEGGGGGSDGAPPPPPPACGFTDEEVDDLFANVSQESVNEWHTTSIGSFEVDPVSGYLYRPYTGKWHFTNFELANVWYNRYFANYYGEQYKTSVYDPTWKFVNAIFTNTSTPDGFPTCHSGSLTGTFTNGTLGNGNTEANVAGSWTFNYTIACAFGVRGSPVYTGSSTGQVYVGY
ncbi:hypothetical protein GWC95_02250 [Sediminibacterium roseum]|uniref:Uncharacterized protein n=1 Tax=Sediminibacterium roseum TaxID=1978412 RepID=A0ABW9ZQH8_9BACT|nr:hypothetical protein [Sediminibacterium roseum]NCI48727.1 hypothetical protein [Sediminibacterium roseum]